MSKNHAKTPIQTDWIKQIENWKTKWKLQLKAIGVICRKKKHHKVWFCSQIKEKQGIGFRWLFSALWVQEYSMDGFNWNGVLSKKNRKPLLITPRNQSYGNMDISVKKHKNFYLKIDSVHRKKVYENDNGRHALTIKDMISQIWVSHRTKTCFSGILRT